MPQQISAVTLLVPTYDEGIAFYVDKLGFDLVQDTKLSETKRWVQVAPPPASALAGQQAAPQKTALLLAKADSPDQIAAIGNQTGGRVGFFLQTDNFARDHAAMQAAGVVFQEDPRHEPYGTVAVFADPWGNRWDLIQFKHTTK